MFEGVSELLFQKNPTEIAKGLFKENYLGEEAIHKMEELLQNKGINVIFNIPKKEFPFDEEELRSSEIANKMLVLYPETMTVANGKPHGINILGLRDLFCRYVKNPKDNSKDLTFYDNNLFPKGNEHFFSYNPHMDNQDFMGKKLTPGYAVITTDFIPGSTNVTWDEQQSLLKPGETPLSAIETVWSSLLHYAVTEKKLLCKERWNATNDTDKSIKNDRIVILGEANSTGLEMKYWKKWKKDPEIGMLSQLRL